MIKIIGLVYLFTFLILFSFFQFSSSSIAQTNTPINQTFTHENQNQLSTSFFQLKNHQFHKYITNLNVVYLLLLIAIYGLFLEMTHPGFILPGILGTLALVIALYAFQFISFNYSGLALMILGIACMIFELYVSSFGMIGIGGVFAFIAGSILLFDVNANQHVDWSILITMSAISLIFFLSILFLAISSQRKKVVTGEEGLIGSMGTIESAHDNVVIVRVLGELWSAQSKESLKPGDKIKVKKVNGLHLLVEKYKNNGS